MLHVGFDVFTAVSMAMVIWVLASRTLVTGCTVCSSGIQCFGKYKRFGEKYYLHLQPEDLDGMFLQNVVIYRLVFTAPKSRTTTLLLGLNSAWEMDVFRFLLRSSVLIGALSF
jgi:hypothetical protein